MSAHIYAPKPLTRLAHIETCPCCNKRSVFVAWHVECRLRPLTSAASGRLCITDGALL